jgi:hypothetical protein
MKLFILYIHFTASYVGAYVACIKDVYFLLESLYVSRKVYISCDFRGCMFINSAIFSNSKITQTFISHIGNSHYSHIQLLFSVVICRYSSTSV